MCGSRRSLSPSPIRLKPKVVYTKAIPGNRLSQGALLIYLIPMEIASPQSGDGGCEPRPRKDRVVVDMIVPGRFKDTMTIRDGMILGRIYFTINDVFVSPKALPVSTKAILRRDSVFALTVRA